MVGVAEGSDRPNEEADVERAGTIVLFQKLDASSRKFDDVSDERVAGPGDALRCGSHHMDCLSAQRAFQQGDKASSLEIEPGSNITDDASVRVTTAQEPLLGVERRSLPGTGDADVKDRVGLDGNPDPAMSAGCPLKSLIAPSLDPASYGLRRDLLASRKTCRRHPHIAT